MKLSREKINHLSNLLIKDFDNRDELDYKIHLNDIRLEIVKVFMESLKIDDDADTAARKILASYNTKSLREGTDEWDVLYHKHYEEYLFKHGAD